MSHGHRVGQSSGVYCSATCFFSSEKYIMDIIPSQCICYIIIIIKPNSVLGTGLMLYLDCLI